MANIKGSYIVSVTLSVTLLSSMSNIKVTYIVSIKGQQENRKNTSTETHIIINVIVKHKRKLISFQSIFNCHISGWNILQLYHGDGRKQRSSHCHSPQLSSQVRLQWLSLWPKTYEVQQEICNIFWNFGISKSLYNIFVNKLSFIL